MRIGELLNTKMIDLNLKEKKIEIFEAQKNRVGRVVYLSSDAISTLRAWIRKRDPAEEYLFYSPQHNMLSYETARYTFKKYINKAGLPHKRYTLHCLRHTYARDMVNADMRLEYLQPILGHSSIEMTRRYARLTDTKHRGRIL
jgi:integrase